MESAPPSGPKPMLQKPPGYREPNTAAKPIPPARKPVLPPSFRPKPRRRGCCRICCCTCCIIFVIIIFVVAVAATLVYILYAPSLPEFHLVSFSFPKFNVTENPDDGTTYLEAETAARVEVKNRSKKMTWYLEGNEVSVSADEGKLNLGWSKVGVLEVKGKEVAELKVETSVKGLALDEKQKRRVKSLVQSRALVPSVEVGSRAGVRVSGWKSWKLAFTLVCGGVTMKHLQNGESPLCSLTLLKLIKIK